MLVVIPKKVKAEITNHFSFLADFFEVVVGVENADLYVYIIKKIVNAFRELIKNKLTSQEKLELFENLRPPLESFIKGEKIIIEEIATTKKTFAEEEIINKGESHTKEEDLNQRKTLYSDNYFDIMIDDKDMLMKFVDELKEHMDESQVTLVDLEKDTYNQENINKVFRAFHTAKSSSAFLGVKNIEEVAHKMEDMLALVRDGKLLITKELIDVVFFGINMFRKFAEIIEKQSYEREKIIEVFKGIDIYGYIAIIKEILDKYQSKKLGEILQDQGLLDAKLVETILQKQTKEKYKRFGEIAIEEHLITEKDLEKTIKKQNTLHRTKSPVFVRVSNEKLNELIDLVGELVINQSMLRQVSSNFGVEIANSDFEDSVFAQLEKTTTNIKNIVLSMGMVPISDVFNKLRVVIRNAAGELQKEVNVEIEGESTELDRNVIENLYDPMVHLVRNSVDHGLEPAEERVKLGKDAQGRIKIEALHRGNSIEIKISDDGQGIDRDSVLKKAIEKKMITEEEASRLDEKSIYNFLFHPGFSTAKSVTELSGRGVGLDVVKRNIEQIHGKIEVRSVRGEYTQFIVKLPLTLAIIDGFVTIINNVKYIFPFNIIDEIIISETAQITTMDNGQIMMYLRDTYIPVVFAAKFLMNLSFHPT